MVMVVMITGPDGGNNDNNNDDDDDDDNYYNDSATSLLQEVFLQVLRFSPLSKNQHLIWFENCKAYYCKAHLIIFTC